MTKSLQATSTDASVELDSITKSYGPTTIIGDTSIHINDGEFVALLRSEEHTSELQSLG